MMGGEDVAGQIGTWLVQVVLPVALTALFLAGIALARKWIARIDDGRIREILEELVRAAEQMFGAGEGKQKLDFVTSALSQRGIVGVTRPQVEATVNSLFPKFDPWPDAEGEGSGAE